MGIALPDQSARDQALDISSSFVVQAPAGSGKTELLTLRYLKLLAACEQPEEVLAITFTKKAASEMRDRIIRALNWCQECEQSGRYPEGGIEQIRFDIAREVLDRDRDSEWRLLGNPSRFRVQTIDSFCFYLAKQLPILSQVGGDPQLLENIDHCFREAIKATLACLDTESDIADDIEILLTHLDNDVARAEDLLSNLLQQRDQWSNHLFKLNMPEQGDGEYLTANIEEWVSESLIQARSQLIEHETVLVSLLNFAADYRSRNDNLQISDYQPLTALPGTTVADLPYWQVMLDFLLTKDSKNPQWLHRIQGRHGFPARTVGDKAFKALNDSLKQQRATLIEHLEQRAGLLETLNYLRLLPSPWLHNSEWRFLSALFRILHLLSAELYLALRKFKVVDYTQISDCAMLALGEEDQPTDIALALDHVIRHILVDEFQDTSYFQRILLQKLTCGWEPDDGRSLFLVGDAMQSCYGFRNANVGIYLDVWERGLPTVELKTLTLSANFRSQAGIVNWVNAVFTEAFPTDMDISRGAVPYSLADAIHPHLDDQNVDINILHYQREAKHLAAVVEADAVAERAVALRKNCPDDSIAILVRNRNHLSSIVPRLRDAGLSWSASDIDRLNSLAVIDDLMGLLRLVLHPGDRLSWIAALRAPWCGLGIRDMHTLATHELAEGNIWHAIRQHQSISDLSPWAQSVLGNFTRVMDFILTMRFRNSLRNTLEAAWSLLRGPNCCTEELELASVQRFFSLVEETEIAGGLTAPGEFEEMIERAFVPGPADIGGSGLHLLTMHKAKGLEFDHVLLPALNRSARSDAKPLLVWHERLNRHGDNRLFMAGLTATGQDDGPLYQLLRHEQKIKNQLESTRLLYIAVTRAKKSATLFATIARNDNGEMTSPASDSLLARIWPVVSDSDRIQLQAIEESPAYRYDSESENNEPEQASLIRRFNQPWQLEEQEERLLQEQLALLDAPDSRSDAERERRFQLESLTGVLVHRCLEHYIEAPDQSAYVDALAQLRTYWQLQLRHLGLSESELAEQLDIIETSVRNTVSDAKLAWIFNPALQDSQCELALSRKAQGRVQDKVIDRSFIDTDNVRWVIDYKTGQPGSTENEEQFIATQKSLHKEQLEAYKQLFEEMDSRPVKTALLFTSIPSLVELSSS